MWQQKLELYDALVARCPGLKRKGKTVPSTTVNGHMFSMLNKAGELGIRFPKDAQKRYMEELETTEFRSHGAVMRGYVLMPERMWDDLESLAGYLNESYEYAMSLDPK